MFKSYDLLKLEKLSNIVRENSHLFLKNLNLLFDYIKSLDKINPFQLDASRLYEAINSDPLLFNEVPDVAWPYDEEEWKKGSIKASNEIGIEYSSIYVSYNHLNLSDEVLPPFILYEISFYKERGKKSKIENSFSIKFKEEQSQSFVLPKNKEISVEDLVQVQNIIIDEISKNIYEYTGGEICFIFVEFSFTCQEAINRTKREYDMLFESTQNFLSTMHSYNVIPISLYNSNTSPLLSTIVKYFELQKNMSFTSINKEILNYINDKIFLLGKLEKLHRSPLLNYTNYIFEENPYLREKIAIFYIKYDLNAIKRIELPLFGIEYLNLIHYILLEEFMKVKSKKGEIHGLLKARKNLLTKNKDRIIKYVDSIIRKESVKSLKKELGLIKGIY